MMYLDLFFSLESLFLILWNFPILLYAKVRDFLSYFQLEILKLV